MKNRDKLIGYFDGLPKGTVVLANELYASHFSKMTQAAFFKAMERLVSDKVLVRITKGLYAKTYTDNEQILNYFFGENNANGMYIGYRLYSKYGITDVVDEKIELYSNIVSSKTSTIGNIFIKKIPIELDFDNTKVIEALEILEHFDSIINLNKAKFARYARQFALGYNDEAAIYVLKNVHYKKRTIAFLKKIVDMYKQENTLQQFLSYASDYKVPAVQRVAR